MFFEAKEFTNESGMVNLPCDHSPIHVDHLFRELCLGPNTTREGTNPLFSGNGGRSPFVPGTRTPFGSHLSEKGVRQKFPRSRKKGGTARKWVWFRE